MSAQRRATAQELREALAEGSLVVHYQPVVELTAGTVVGVEALVRWPHATLGWLRPDEFVGLAEETGLIDELGTAVLQEACREVARWGEAHPELGALSVAVNVSAHQLHGGQLLSSTRRALATSGLAPDQLCLELTESVLLDDSPCVEASLRGLRDLGVRIGIDDFGTGYSSLSYLQRLPVDALKIDRSFVRNLRPGGAPQPDRAVVASVIDLAHAFGMTSIAEGVETAEQLLALVELGCE